MAAKIDTRKTKKYDSRRSNRSAESELYLTACDPVNFRHYTDVAIRYLCKLDGPKATNLNNIKCTERHLQSIPVVKSHLLAVKTVNDIIDCSDIIEPYCNCRQLHRGTDYKENGELSTIGVENRAYGHISKKEKMDNIAAYIAKMWTNIHSATKHTINRARSTDVRKCIPHLYFLSLAFFPLDTYQRMERWHIISFTVPFDHFLIAVLSII